MSDVIRKFEVSFLGDASRLSKAFKEVAGHGEKAEAHTNKFGSSLKHLVEALGVAEGIHKVAEFLDEATRAAAKDEAQMATLANLVNRSGVSWKRHGEEITHFLEKSAAASGFMKSDLADAYGRLITTTKNAGESQKLLGTAEDISRARHVDLTTAASLLAKAYNGQYTGIRRLGIQVDSTTAAQDRLKAAYDRLLATGHKLTETQKLQYAAELAHAKASDKMASAINALDAVHKAYAGSSATYAKTSAGAMARLGVQWEEFKVGIGKRILPILAQASTWLADRLPAASQKLSVIMGKVTAFISSVWKAWGGDITRVATFLWNTLKPMFEAGAAELKQVFLILGDVLQGHWSAAWTHIKQLPSIVWTVIKAEMRAAATILGAEARIIGSAIWNGLMGVLGALGGALKGMIAWAFDTGVIDPANSLINKLVGVEKSIPGSPNLGIGNNPIPRLAMGGIVTRPTVALIGEAGPEMVVPMTGRNAGLGGGMTFVFNQVPAAANPHAIAAAVSWRLRTMST